MHTYNLEHLSWTLTGWNPFEWRIPRTDDITNGKDAYVHPIPAPVPGSVQQALLNAGLIPDWNIGVQARQSEWVENRHWIYTTKLPAHWLSGQRIRLRALGLDYCGWLFLNGQEIATFSNSLIPHVFDLSPHIPTQPTEDITLHLIFDCPPRWLGQFGHTPHMTSWKPRFNYTWDWTPRLVQIGIWDDLTLEVSNAQEIDSLRCLTNVESNSSDTSFTTNTPGILHIQGTTTAHAQSTLHVSLTPLNSDTIIHEGTYNLSDFSTGITWTNLPIDLWYPNGSGPQPLYKVHVSLHTPDNTISHSLTRQVGFKHISWQPCLDAPAEADPWICVINGQPTFLQGVNWTPIRPNFADVQPDQYRSLLTTYRDMGCNILRVWGGAYLEKTCFYELCDELGLLVWQELPLSSSGVNNNPPEDPASVQALTTIALSYIIRRQHHVSLLLWSGGNELQSYPGTEEPASCATSPLLALFKELVTTADPGRRFVATSPSGPRFLADESEMGLGLHWDTHGPWIAEGDLTQDWTRYWHKDDSLFRSEVGAPGSSSAALIQTYAGTHPTMPANWDNELWRRTGWWIEWPQFLADHNLTPDAEHTVTLEEYVNWHQQRQTQALTIAAQACKARFPRCGGFMIWMGHDSFPCSANTSIIDFDGHPKPATHALSATFNSRSAALAAADHT